MLENFESRLASKTVIVSSLGTYQGLHNASVQNSGESCGSIMSTLIKNHKMFDEDNDGLSKKGITDVIDHGFLLMHRKFGCTNRILQDEALDGSGLLSNEVYDHQFKYCYYWEEKIIKNFFSQIHLLENLAGVSICFREHMVTVLIYPTTAPRYLFIEPLRQDPSSSLTKTQYGFSIACDDVDGITSSILHWIFHNRLHGLHSNSVRFYEKYKGGKKNDEANIVGFCLIHDRIETSVMSKPVPTSTNVFDPDNYKLCGRFNARKYYISVAAVGSE